MSQKKTLKTCAGEIVLDGRKVAFLPESGTLLVADMHFEKGSYLRTKGRSMLPAYDTHDTVERLWAIAQDYRPKQIVALGDSFHDIEADTRLSPQSADRLNAFETALCNIIWVLGNHDPDIPEAVRGTREDHVQIGKFLLTHHPLDHDGGYNICGHYHPKDKVSSAKGSVSAPCFAISPTRMIMPSFGTYTGGLYVTDPAFKQAMPDLMSVALTYEERVFQIAASHRQELGKQTQ